MSVLLAASVFAQLSCASRSTDDPAGAVSSTFASSMQASEQAESSHSAAKGCRGEEDGAAAGQSEWSHPFLEKLHSVLLRAHQEVERIKTYSFTPVITVSGVVSNDPSNSETENGALLDVDAAYNQREIYCAHASNKVAFGKLLHTNLDDLCKSYADLQRAEEAEWVGRMSVSPSLLTLLASPKSAGKISIIIDANDDSMLYNLSSADNSKGVTPSCFGARLVRLFRQCIRLCDLARDYRQSVTAPSSTGAHSNDTCERARVGIDEQRNTLVFVLCNILTKLKNEMRALVILNTKIMKRRENVMRVTVINEY
ncbi:hypothetical protein PAPHI01_2331 [Pancytospora philotis]|nr:hypothetical protein PAPHI01_2331 [Pancytospora philotis]